MGVCSPAGTHARPEPASAGSPPGERETASPAYAPPGAPLCYYDPSVSGLTAGSDALVSDPKHAVVERFRRDSILDAARHVIARKGRGGASMQAIADEAGVAKGTLYLYFRDRDDLLQHTGDLVFDELLVRLKAVLDQPRPLPESLHDLVRTKLEFFDENQDFLRVYMALRHGDPAASRRRRRQASQYTRYLEMLTRHLGAAAARGEMKPFDPERVALVFAEGVAAILLHRLEGSAPPHAEEVDWIVDMLLNGLCPRRDS